MSRIDNNYFTYRQTPTTENGTGTLVDIKGQTLKWNQFCCKGRYFTRGNNEWQNTFTENGVTFTYLDDYTVRIAGTPTARAYIYLNRLDDSANYPVKQGEKLLLRCSNVPNGIDIFSSFYYDNTWKGAGPQKSNKYVTVPSDVNKLVCMGIDVQASLVGQTIDVTVSLNVFNLTKMFGSGNEPTEEEFNSLFPFYYPYNSGSLIPFNGNGIKTTGKNKLNLGASRTATSNGVTLSYDAITQKVTLSGRNTKTDGAYIIAEFTPSAIPKFKIGETYVVSASSQIPTNTYFNLVYRDANNALRAFPLTQIETRRAWRFTVPSNYVSFVSFQFGVLKEATDVNGTFGVQIEKGSSVTSYEPYTSSTLSLPISTYFPSGMKDVPDYTNGGKIYDEMTSNKADTRVGSVDLGTLNWTTYSSPERHVFRAYILSNMKEPNGANLPNAMCSRYEPMAYNPISANDDGYFAIGAQRIVIIEHDYTDPVAFKESLSNVYLYYELATPTETDISPELDLTFNIDVGGTEELLPTNTSTPTTTPILCDILYRGLIPVSVTVYPLGAGTVEGAGQYRYGETVTLVAESSDGIYRFLRYEDENGDTLSTNSTYSFIAGE